MQNTTEKIFPVLGTDVASGANISLPLINDIAAGKIISGNVMIAGNGGSGLTYRTKLMMLRYYKAGYRVLGVAPHFGQKLFGKFAEQCGGQVLTLGKDCFINIMGIVPVVKRGKSLESNIKLAKETLDNRVAVVSNFVELVCGCHSENVQQVWNQYGELYAAKPEFLQNADTFRLGWRHAATRHSAGRC